MWHFNLAISVWFALVAVSSSGIMFNLLFFRNEQAAGKKIKFSLLLFSLLAPLMILLVSNGEGFLEIIHSRGIFWTSNSNQQMLSSVWKWVDVKELTEPPELPLNWQPGRAGGTWWWRASRVLQDYTVNGQSREIIDEFPLFSFLLADLHPHLLSMPFVLLVIYFGLSRFFQQNIIGIQDFKVISYIKDNQLFVSGLFLGGLLFVNTWDFPIYLGFYILLRYFQIDQRPGINKWVIKDLFAFSSFLILISLILYAPFLMGLSSQAGGFLPSLVFKTRGIQFLIMFFPQIILILWMFAVIAEDAFSFKKFSVSVIFGILISLLLFLSSLLYLLLPNLTTSLLRHIAELTGFDIQVKLTSLQNAAGSLLGIFGAGSIRELIKKQ